MNDIDIHAGALKPVQQQLSAAYEQLTTSGDGGIRVLVRKQARDIGSAVGGLGDSGVSLRNYHAQVSDSIGQLLTMAISELHSINNSLDNTITQVEAHEHTRSASGGKVADSGGQG